MYSKVVCARIWLVLINELHALIIIYASNAVNNTTPTHNPSTARQRQAIVDGLKNSVNDFQKDVKGTSSTDVMDILLLTQYFDLLKDVGANTIYLRSGPDEVANLKMDLHKSVGQAGNRSKNSFF